MRTYGNLRKSSAAKLQKYTKNLNRDAMNQLVRKLDEYVKNGNGWIVKGIEKVIPVLISYKRPNPFKGHGDVDLPEALKT